MSGKRTIGITTYGYAPADLLNLARTAERLGFEGIWFGEHYVSPERYEGHHPSRKETPKDQNDARDKAIIGEDVRIYDPFFLLGAVAGATTRLKIGTAICIVPMNHPLLLARQIITAQEVSNGRFLFGTGAGWLKEEFDAVGLPFHERGARMDEMFEIMKKAQAGGFFEHHGKYFDFESLQITPHPVTVPLVCGGNTGPALRRVATIADAWINSAMVTLEEVLPMRDTIERERAARGTAGRPFQYFVRPTGPEPELVDSFLREGFDNIILWGPHVWPQDETIPLEVKVEGLTRVARSLGLSPPAAVAA